MNAPRASESPDDEWRDQVVLYSLDALSSDETRQVEAQLAASAESRALLDALRQDLVALSDGLEVDPPPQLRDRVLAAVRTTPQDSPPFTAPSSASTPRSGTTDLDAARHRRQSARGAAASRRQGWLIGLVAAAAVAVGAVAVTTQWGDQPEVPLADQVLEADDAVSWSDSAEGADYTVVYSASMDRTVLVVENAPEVPSDRAIQAWLVPADGNPVSAGLLPDGDSVELVLEGDLNRAAAVAFTIEPQGGSTAPTTEPFLAIPLEG